MFEVINRRTKARTAFQLLELIFHFTVREMAENNRNPGLALLANIGQTIAFVGVFYLMFTLTGIMSGAPIRGDMLLFLMSGVFMFMTHIKTSSKVSGAAAPGSGMMLHAPMTTAVSLAAQALASLYIQLATIVVILGFYELLTGKVEIDQPIGAFAMFLLAWFSGVCFGVLLYAIKTAYPKLGQGIMVVYRRLNMVFSGKMTPANTLPASVFPMFAWNPLFHILDKGRGYVFLNYTSHRADIQYALICCAVALFLGLLGEFYNRQSMRMARSE